MNDFHKKVFKNTKKSSKFAFKKGVFKKWKLFHFWGAQESRLAQTANRKRPFTRRIENRPKTAFKGGGSKKRRFSKKAFFRKWKSFRFSPKKAFLKPPQPQGGGGPS